MNLYKITTDEEFVEYDTYDSAVVVAESEEQAREIRGDEFTGLFWVQKTKDLKVELVGKADDSFTSPCVLIASFNAG